MFNELEHIELLHLAYRLCRGRHVDPDAGLEQVDHDEAEADRDQAGDDEPGDRARSDAAERRSEEHTSELQSLIRNSYAVFCFKKKIQLSRTQYTQQRRR